MSETTFDPISKSLSEILLGCHGGTFQLPDFQRGWVWDVDRIRDLVASVSRNFPIGALMTLRTGGAVAFAPRRVQGAPDTIRPSDAEQLLLDGQQRTTSLYQCFKKRGPIEAQDIRTKKPKYLHLYFDIFAVVDGTIDRAEAIVELPETKIIKPSDRFPEGLDLRERSAEFTHMMFPVQDALEWDSWQDDFYEDLRNQPDGESRRNAYRVFKKTVLEVIKAYRIPIIALAKETTKEAVCTVFEKVNTGGKPLDAFELLTAIYAGDPGGGYPLREFWYGSEAAPGKEAKIGLQKQLHSYLKSEEKPEGVLGALTSIDFLQAITLFHRRTLRLEAEAAGVDAKKLPQTAPKREYILDLPLSVFKQWKDAVEAGFRSAAKHLFTFGIFDRRGLPYQPQTVVLAALFAHLGKKTEHTAVLDKISRWYWCGVFGDAYRSSVESTMARDFKEVIDWIEGGDEPETVRMAKFDADRIDHIYNRQTAAFRGIDALLKQQGAVDFRSGKKMDNTVFFDEAVDVHHIFPAKWCKDSRKDPAIWDSVLNKTPLGASTNRIIGGVAPREYLNKLQVGGDGVDPIAKETLNSYLRSHLIDPDLLWENDFEGVLRARKKALVTLVECAMGKSAIKGSPAEELQDEFVEPDVLEAAQTIDSQPLTAL